jgi:N-acetylglucosaminyldiphosphoundecaprenol N-acetyl-beta-D-mannosaminyltransferase
MASMQLSRLLVSPCVAPVATSQLYSTDPIMEIPRFNVLGVAVSGMNLGIAVAAMLEAVRERRKGYICVSDVRAIVDAQHDAEFRGILNRSFLTTSDGMPLVWLGRHYVGRHVGRVYGPDLMLEMFTATQTRPCRHFLYGGAPGVAEELSARLEERFPGATVCGTYTPPFRPLSPEEDAEFIEVIRVRRPDIIWVGISTPKQERFMAGYLARLDTTLMVGVGAAFDFHSGRVRQAPRWVQRSGLEWLFRIASEPRRLWRRYFVSVPFFLGRITLQLLRLRKYPIETNPTPS